MTTTTYVVKYGDWLAKIAEDHGTTVSAIWNHPENAEHRQKRGSPDVLYPGDVLRIDVAAPAPEEPPPPAEPSQPDAPAPPPGSWPYPPFEGPWASKPTWECPGGTCACHPVPEDAPKKEHVIVFYDPKGVRLPGARCQVYEQGRLLTPEGTAADGAGELRVELRAETSTLRVEWAPPALPPNQFLPYRKIYNVKMGGEGDVGLDRRLANLGFSSGRRREDNVRDYQRAYSRPPTGNAEEIRLEVLERHDNGTLTPFHPQPATGPHEKAPPQARSLFGSPTPRSGGSSLLAPDEQQGGGGGGGGGATTPSGQNVQGAAVPDAADLMLVVMLAPDYGKIDPKNTKVRLKPKVVPSMTEEQRAKQVEPTVKPSSADAPAIYEFKDLPTGTYDALVYIDKIKRGPNQYDTFAMGHTEVTVKKALLNQGWVTAEIGRPIHTVDDPLLDIDAEPIQRRRKVLATIFELFPMSFDWNTNKQDMPPYGQGKFDEMLVGKGDKDTCTAVTGSTMKNALGTAFGEGLLDKPYFVKYAEGLAPSVGDCVYYATGSHFEHIGIIVESSPDPDCNWIAADGGQPSQASPLMKGTNGLWGRFWHKPEYQGDSSQSAWLFPRRFIKRNGVATAVHGWASPVWDKDKRHGFRAPGYDIVGWADISHPAFFASTSGYTDKFSEKDYRDCKMLIRKVRDGALADQKACLDAVNRAEPPPKP